MRIRLSNRSINAYYYRAGTGFRPGILFLPDLMGVNDTLKESAQLLAQEGYHVLLPDLYSDEGMAKYCLRMLFQWDFVSNKANNSGMKEIREILEFFRSIPEVNGDKIGVIGQCLTGGYVLHTAYLEGVKAPVVFHHSFGVVGSGMPEEDARKICQKVQGHFVHVDPFCPESRVNELKKQLGNYLEVNYYDYLPHGIPHFFRLTSEGKRAWTNMVRFLKMQLMEE
ncbi:MAG: dienelactone hydrolase [Candidatus Hydrogenedentota bacterium]|nr:MAG: dienelactone hydrolase [Candidatus Hydrogenedentota bacterium]